MNRSRSPRTRSPRARSPRARSPRTQSSKYANAVAEFISALFNSRSQAHIFHLQTKSFARHKALNAYYDAIVPLADTYAEAYQGKYGIIKGYKAPKQYLQGDDKIVKYFKDLEDVVVYFNSRLPKDDDLVNTYASILDLVHSTNYLLTLQ